MTLADLRSQLQALPAGTTFTRDGVLELLERAVEEEPAGNADLTAAELARRWNRGGSTIRTMCENGELPAAYKFRGREWRIPQASVRAYEAAERERGASDAADPLPARPLGKRTVDLRALAKGRRTNGGGTSKPAPS